jgi:hypothetical protein
MALIVVQNGFTSGCCRWRPKMAVPTFFIIIFFPSKKLQESTRESVGLEFGLGSLGLSSRFSPLLQTLLFPFFALLFVSGEMG